MFFEVNLKNKLVEDISNKVIKRLENHISRVYNDNMYNILNRESIDYMNTCLIKFIIDEMKSNIDINNFIGSSITHILSDGIFVKNAILSLRNDSEYYSLIFNLINDIIINNNDDISVLAPYIITLANMSYSSIIYYTFSNDKNINKCEPAINNYNEFMLLLEIFILILKSSLVDIFINYRKNRVNFR